VEALRPERGGSGKSITLAAIIGRINRTRAKHVVSEDNTPMLQSLLQSGKGVAMKAMDDALLAAAREGRVRPEDAAAKAHDKPRFQSLLSGGATSA
jgi:Tfp pilus assembly pilus retraction ATPase PilT